MTAAEKARNVVDSCATSTTNSRDLAVAIKEKANQYFKEEEYDVAAELYTKCIEHEPGVALYYGNRSFAYLKRELYGLALVDADKALELDPTYAKAYYRRASANMALSKFKLALGDYDRVCKMRPNDKDAQQKFEACQKIVRRIAFEKAISSDHSTTSVADSIKPEDFVVESDYKGPHLEDSISMEFMEELITTFKDQRKLHTRYAYKILLAVRKYLMELPSMVEIQVPDKQKFTICGDVHGQFYDLCNIFELNGLPSETNPYLFNGDFVDRGSFSVETIFTLFGFKLLLPNHFFMSRGNHESDVMNKMYGFEGEVKSKFNAKMAELFTEIFNYLPLCHLINSKIFVCHGGLFKEDGVTLDKIAKTKRDRQPPDEGIMCDLLWSDPQDPPGRSPSKRGVGIQFGPDVTTRFLEENGLLYVVRSHEVKPDGYEMHHGGKCWTIFSAPNYCDTIGNKGAYITVTGDKLYPPELHSFDAVPHPTVRAMQDKIAKTKKDVRPSQNEGRDVAPDGVKLVDKCTQTESVDYKKPKSWSQIVQNEDRFDASDTLHQFLGGMSLTVYLEDIYRNQIPILRKSFWEKMRNKAEWVEQNLKQNGEITVEIREEVMKLSQNWISNKENLSIVPVEMVHTPETLLAVGKLFLAIQDSRIAAELFWGATVLAIKNYAEVLGFDALKLLRNSTHHILFVKALENLVKTRNLFKGEEITLSSDFLQGKWLHTDSFYDGALTVKNVSDTQKYVERFLKKIRQMPQQITVEEKEMISRDL